MKKLYILSLIVSLFTAQSFSLEYKLMVRRENKTGKSTLIEKTLDGKTSVEFGFSRTMFKCGDGEPISSDGASFKRLVCIVPKTSAVIFNCLCRGKEVSVCVSATFPKPISLTNFDNNDTITVEVYCVP